MRKFLQVVLAASGSYVAVFAQAPVNDEPSGAIPVFVGANSGPGFSTKFATVSFGMPNIACGFATADVWFLFTPVATGPHIIHTAPLAGTAPGSLRDSVLGAYSASLTSILACDTDAAATPSPDSGAHMSKLMLNLDAGVPIYLRVARTSSYPDGTFSVAVVDSTLNGGVNGGATCAAAPLIGDGFWHGQLALDVPSGSTIGGCANFTPTTNDLWYLYVPSVSGVANVYVEGVFTGIFRMAVYELGGGCGVETLVAGTCVTARNATFAATAGTPYLVRIGSTSSTASTLWGLFGMSIATTAPTSNDTCATAAVLVEGDNYLTLSGATAEPSVGAACPSGSFSAATNLDVWGTYTTPAPGRAVFGSRGLGSLQLAVYSGTCAASTPIACGGGTGVVVVNDYVGGTTYLCRGGTTSASNVSAVNFDVTFTPFPPNDECTGAIPIPVGANVGLVNHASTTSPTSPSCKTVYDDVWYSFTPAVSSWLRIDGCGSTIDAVFAVYSACGAEIACDDNDATNTGPCAAAQTLNPFVRFFATAGTTYLLRVGSVAAADITFSVRFVHEYTFTAAYDAPTSTATMTDAAGEPGHASLRVFTTIAGAYPNGWFHGVDIPFFDLIGLVGFGSPFLAPLDASGGATSTLHGIPPIGATFYYVGVLYSPAGVFVKASAPASITLL
jgi:hypothetical protein